MKFSIEQIFTIILIVSLATGHILSFLRLYVQIVINREQASSLVIWLTATVGACFHSLYVFTFITAAYFAVSYIGEFFKYI